MIIIKIEKSELLKLLQAEHDVELIKNNLDKALELLAEGKSKDEVISIIRILRNEL